MALIIFALARPQWGTEVREIDQEGLQVMVALDVSQSMLADDVKPSRLDRAKLEIALARGKRRYDKRATIAKREADRSMQRALRRDG